VIEPTFVTPLASEYSAPGGPWSGQTLSALLEEMPRRPDLIVSARGVLASDELFALARTVAGGLRARGVQHGDAVAWQVPNGLEAAILYCATWWLGAVAVPLHQQLTPPEIDAVLATLRGQVDHVVVDMHAEATSEKVAMGWFLDGRVTAVVGTHTHIVTGDERRIRQVIFNLVSNAVKYTETGRVLLGISAEAARRGPGARCRWSSHRRCRSSA
jgi:acyl-CoA synthetase (AMP-forming)/AMP-acid ligase II